MKHVVVLTTGGTISTRDVDGSGARPVLRGQDLLQQIPDLGAVAEVEVAELAFVPGAFMTLATMRQMSERARQILSQPQVAGLGGTPRTGTVGEKADPLYLTGATDKTGGFPRAMRESSPIGFDGERNLY